MKTTTTQPQGSPASACWAFRGWLVSWTAIRLGLFEWHWKPRIKARWDKPTSGWTGNYLDTDEVTLSIEWLSGYAEFTITPNDKTLATGGAATRATEAAQPKNQD